jgi:hypothetical protein
MPPPPARYGAAPRHTPANMHTGRSPAQTYVPRASAASTGQKRPVISARRGGIPSGSAGQWPNMELAGRARAKGVRSARAALPVRSARLPGNQGTPRGDTAARSNSSTARSARRPAFHRWFLHGVGGPGGMSGPRAPHERDAAVLRLEGRHPGMATRRRTPTLSALNRAEIKGGGKGEGVCGGAHVGTAV